MVNEVVFSVYIESPNSILLATDKKKLYRYKISNKQKEVVFDSRIQTNAR